MQLQSSSTKQNKTTKQYVLYLYICDHQVVRRRDKNTEVAFLAKYLFNVCNRQPFSCVKIQQLCILIDIYRKTAVLTLKSSPVKLQAIISSAKNEHSINVHRISIYPGKVSYRFEVFHSFNFTLQKTVLQGDEGFVDFFNTFLALPVSLDNNMISMCTGDWITCQCICKQFHSDCFLHETKNKPVSPNELS